MHRHLVIALAVLTTTSVTLPGGAAEQGHDAKQASAMVGQMIVSYHNDMCLTVAGNNPFNGAGLLMWPCEGNPNQRWYFDEWNRLHTALDGNRCLDVAGGNTGSGAALQLLDCTAHRAQQWEWGGDSRRYLVNRNSSKVLDITDGNAGAGAGVKIFDYQWLQSNQMWRPI